jgi:di/tricarboxylate transporter
MLLRYAVFIFTDSQPPRLNMLKWALLITIIMLTIATVGPMIPAMKDLNISNLFVLCLIASIVMVGTGIISQQECRDAINWEVYITIASAYGIGTALTSSGLATVLADFLVTIGIGLNIGPAGLYGAVYFATFLISNIVTNNAAAALMFPIAIKVAEDESLGVSPQLMAYCLMLSASASFMTPFGYQTNLLIYGSGGYNVKDFLKIGAPMQLILWVFTTLILTNPTGMWWPSWVATGIVFIVVSAVLVSSSSLRDGLKLGLGSKKPMASIAAK